MPEPLARTKMPSPVLKFAPPSTVLALIVPDIVPASLSWATKNAAPAETVPVVGAVQALCEMSKVRFVVPPAAPLRMSTSPPPEMMASVFVMVLWRKTTSMVVFWLAIVSNAAPRVPVMVLPWPAASPPKVTFNVVPLL